MCGGAQNVLNQGFLPRYILASFAMEAKKNISKNQCIVNWIDYLTDILLWKPHKSFKICLLKFMFSKKATKIDKIFTVNLTLA